MKSNGDVARGWLEKAASDIAAAELCVEADRALDAACFHCQQAAEKFLKAWLIAREAEFPFVHDLRQLVTLCAALDPEFQHLEGEALLLNPYAVELRYSPVLWPTRADAIEALQTTKRVREVVMDRWPGV